MNCEKCVSRKVCFVQEQIRNLAFRMVGKPFYDDVDTETERTISVGEQYKKRMIKHYDIHCKLMGIIASNCLLYVEKIR